MAAADRGGKGRQAGDGVCAGGAARPGSRRTSPASWESLIYTARAPIGVLLFAAVGLLLPPQTDDMLAALAVGTVHGISTGAMFELSLALVAVGCWYWARATLSARFGDSDKHRKGRQPGDARPDVAINET